MKLKIRIKEIDFCDILMKALPVLGKNAPNNGKAISRILSVVSQLPAEAVRPLVDALPRNELYQIASLLVRENKYKIMNALSQLLKQKGFDLKVSDISLSSQLELSITIQNLSFATLAAKYLPLYTSTHIIHENPFMDVLSFYVSIPTKLLCAMLSKISPAKIDETIVNLINKNKGGIMKKIESMMAKQGIRIRLEDLVLENGYSTAISVQTSSKRATR